MAKTKNVHAHQLAALVSVASSLFYVFYVAQWLTSYQAENSYSSIVRVLPGKYFLALAVVTGVWTMVKAGRVKLLVALALGMTLAASYIWLYLAVVTKVA